MFKPDQTVKYMLYGQFMMVGLLMKEQLVLQDQLMVVQLMSLL